MKKQSRLTMNIGIISFVVIFIVLCLVTFATLSLVSAKSNERSTNLSVEHTQEYYDLNNKAQEELKTIDDQLFTLYKESSSMTQYYDNLKNLDSRYTINERTLSFVIKGKTQNLEVTLNVLYPGDRYYSIRSWNIQSSKEWNMESQDTLL